MRRLTSVVRTLTPTSHRMKLGMGHLHFDSLSLSHSGPLLQTTEGREKGEKETRWQSRILERRRSKEKEEKRRRSDGRTICSSFGTNSFHDFINSSDSAPDNTLQAVVYGGRVGWALYQQPGWMECLRAKCACEFNCPLQTILSCTLGEEHVSTGSEREGMCTMCACLSRNPKHFPVPFRVSFSHLTLYLHTTDICYNARSPSWVRPLILTCMHSLLIK